MKQICIGTCIPGSYFTTWVPALLDEGFECFSINFHMEFGGVDLNQLAQQSTQLLDGTGIKLASLGYYCNALQFEEHRKK